MIKKQERGSSMKMNPITINGNISSVSFNSCNLEDLTVIIGGYIITPNGEIIIVSDHEEHCNVFSKYINCYLENDSKQIYDTLTATRTLCELGCCVYSGIRYQEYISHKTEGYNDEFAALTFPRDMELTEKQKIICQKLMMSNKSSISNNEKIYIQYGTFPDIVLTTEEVSKILVKKEETK